MLVGRGVGRGAFKGAALIGAFAIIVAIWWWNAFLLTAAADQNLQLIKIITGALPFDWGRKVEMRCAFSVPIAPFLLVEAIAIAKILMLAIVYPFRRRRP